MELSRKTGEIQGGITYENLDEYLGMLANQMQAVPGFLPEQAAAPAFGAAVTQPTEPPADAMLGYPSGMRSLFTQLPMMQEKSKSGLWDLLNLSPK